MSEPDQSETAAPAVGTPLDCGVGRLVPERVEHSTLLALAAAAAEIPCKGWCPPGARTDGWHGMYTGSDDDGAYKRWNPLTDDGDALALAVRMEMDVFVRAGRWTEAVRPMGPACKQPHDGDPLAATRLAIVRAAVEVAPHASPDDAWRAKPHQPLPDRRMTPNAELTGRPALR